MNKEYIKRRLSTAGDFIRAVGVKTRYKSVVVSRNIIKNLKKAAKFTGRQILTAAGIAAESLNRTGSIVRCKVGKFFQRLFIGFKSAAKKLFYKIKENKKKVAAGVVAVGVFVLCGVSIINSLTAYEYSYKGETLGVVSEAESVYQGVEEAEKTLTEEVGAQVVIDAAEGIQIKKVIGGAAVGDVSEEKDVVDALTAIEEIKVVTYTINITDTTNKKTGETTTRAINLDTREHAQEVLEAVKASYTKDIPLEKLVDVTFEEDVEIEETEASLEDIVSTQEAVKAITSGGIKEKAHIVKLGDSVAAIADKYDVPRKLLKKWNPHIREDNILYLNQKIQLREQIPLINVITKRNETITEDYNSKIEYRDTDNLYEGMEKVIKKGKSGNHTVNADIIERNGVQTDRIDLSQVVHKEAVTQVVMRGTKERPESIGKGYYDYPMNGSFSSPFGPRWGRLHAGIDISGSTGTGVYAADAGVVVEAGATSNGYGIAVQIDHGNGRTTYYAHNSKVRVKVGDTVYRGQHIADSGNTGNSTGPHLHFETRFGGVPKDPQKYL